MSSPGWRPLSAPREGAEAFVVSPFGRLARAHAVAVAGDTLVAIALAGTLFFSIEVGEARGEVFLYLALTMAPFAVVAPLIGPTLDRASGGRRWMVLGTTGLRAVVCLIMIDDVHSLLLFPEAFALLVLAKGYHVAKSALVPSVVPSSEGLVEANSKLAVISGLVGGAAAVPGAAVLHFGGSEWVLALAACVFAVAAVLSWRIPNIAVAPEAETEEAREELRGTGVLLAASAMGLLRGIVGFLTFLLAFALRADEAPSWHFGLVLGLSALSALTGAALAPSLRTLTTEERIITGSLAAVALCALGAAWLDGLGGAALAAVAVGIGAASARQAFDSIVQRDAPDANRGRSFARFETRFQLIWVVGAVVGIVPMPTWSGFLVVAITAAFAGVSYTAGSRGARVLAMRRLERIRRRREERRAAAPPDRTTILGTDLTRIDEPPVLPPSIATPVDPTAIERDDHHP